MIRKPVLSTAASVLIAGLALTACGSTRTVDSLGRTQGAGTTGNGSSALGGDLGGLVEQPGTLTPVVGGEQVTQDPGSSPTAEPTASESSAPDDYSYDPGDYTYTPEVTHGPGVTPTAINVGLVYPSDDGGQAALGNTTATVGDMKAEATAVINDINSKGGAAGRKLTLITHPYTTNDGSSDQISAAACADFTQDHKVIAAAPLPIESFINCISKAGGVASAGSLATFPDAAYKTFPYYYDVSALSTDRLSTNLASYLVNKGYFSKWDSRQGAPGSAPVKVGIIAPDTAGWKDVTGKVLVPALAKLGIKVAAEDVRIWHFPEGASGNGSAVAEIQGLVLRMRSDNVTHVIPTEVNSLVFFAAGAEAQGYRPRYAINSASGPNAFAGGLLPYRQLGGAMGLGYAPIIDLPASQNPENGPYAGKGAAKCRQVMAKAGISFKDANAKAVGYQLCDIYYSLAAAINAIPKGSAINQRSIMKAIENLPKGSFSSANLPSSSFGPGKHYPASTAYDFRYYADCKCAHYAGAPFALK